MSCLLLSAVRAVFSRCCIQSVLYLAGAVSSRCGIQPELYIQPGPVLLFLSIGERCRAGTEAFYFFLRITQIVIPKARRTTGIRMTNRMVRRTAVRVAMVMVVLSMDFDGMEIVVVSEVTALIEPLKSDRLEPETIWFALSLKMYGDVYTTAVDVMVSVLLSEEELLDTLSAAELEDTDSEDDEVPDTPFAVDELVTVLSAALPSELLIVLTAFRPTIRAAS